MDRRIVKYFTLTAISVLFWVKKMESGSVGRSVHHSGPDWNISKATGWIVIKFSWSPEDESCWLDSVTPWLFFQHHYEIRKCFALSEISRQMFNGLPWFFFQIQITTVPRGGTLLFMVIAWLAKYFFNIYKIVIKYSGFPWVKTALSIFLSVHGIKHS